MRAIRPLIDLLRVLLLVGLVAATAAPGRALAEAPERLEGPAASAWAAALGLTALAGAFLVLALLGRVSSDGLRDQRPWTLTLEGLVAGGLALVPPPLWASWLGATPLVAALVHGWAAPLAAVWLTVVVATAVRRRSHVPTSERQSIFT